MLPKFDDGLKADDYGTVVEPSEIEPILGEGIVYEYTSMGRESKLLFKYSLPLTITYLLQYTFSLVTIFVVGHIGTNELGAVSLATMTANITGLAVYEGLATSKTLKSSTSEYMPTNKHRSRYALCTSIWIRS